MAQTFKLQKPSPKSVLSIDIGHKRIGLAGCDPLGLTITRLPPIIRKSFQEDFETIESHCLYRRVNGLIFGLPLDKYGRVTIQADHCKKYGKKMAIKLNLPLALVNEHCSSWEAGQNYNLQNDRTGQLDSAVAALLLEQWLREGPDLQSPTKIL